VKELELLFKDLLCLLNVFLPRKESKDVTLEVVIENDLYNCAHKGVLENNNKLLLLELPYSPFEAALFDRLRLDRLSPQL
jgi:hypothetical protein